MLFSYLLPSRQGHVKLFVEEIKIVRFFNKKFTMNCLDCKYYFHIIYSTCLDLFLLEFLINLSAFIKTNAEYSWLWKKQKLMIETKETLCRLLTTSLKISKNKTETDIQLF